MRRVDVVIEWINAHPGREFTTNDVREETGIPTEAVSGLLVRLSRYGYCERLTRRTVPRGSTRSDLWRCI